MAGSSSLLAPIDQVDLGLLQVFLGEDFRLGGDGVVLALSPDARHLAVSRGAQAIILHQQTAGQPQPLRNLIGTDDGNVQCMRWVQVDDEDEDEDGSRQILFIGFASGRLSAFALPPAAGASLFACAFSSKLHNTPLIELQPYDNAPSSLLCLFRGGMLARVSDVGALLGTNNSQPAAWKFHLSEEAAHHGGCDAVVCCGPLSHVPLDLEHNGEPAKKVALVTSHAAALHLHHIRAPSSSSDNPHIADAAAIPPPAASAATLLAASARRVAGGGVRETLRRIRGAGARANGEHKGDGASSLMRSFTDPPRSFVSLSLEPTRKRWLAATDSLGRVLVLEPKSLVLVRLFKGYRDATVGWTDADAAGCCGDNGSNGSSNGSLRADDALLVIYAPRRGLLEVWRAPTSGRVAACNVGAGCLLLPAPPSAARVAPGSRLSDDVGEQQQQQQQQRRTRCFVVKPDGVLYLVRRSARPATTASTASAADEAVEHARPELDIAITSDATVSVRLRFA